MEKRRPREARGCSDSRKPRNTRSHQKPEGGLLPTASGGRAALPAPRLQTPGSRNHKQINSHCFKPPGLW